MWTDRAAPSRIGGDALFSFSTIEDILLHFALKAKKISSIVKIQEGEKEAGSAGKVETCVVAVTETKVKKRNKRDDSPGVGGARRGSNADDKQKIS